VRLSLYLTGPPTAIVRNERAVTTREGYGDAAGVFFPRRRAKDGNRAVENETMTRMTRVLGIGGRLRPGIDR
jgi:hypothetical protein